MLTLALPKGRLLDPAITLLAELGIRGIDPDSRRLLQADDAAGLRFILLKPADVPTYVEYGAADLGIVGKDILLEQQPDVYEPVERLSVDVPEEYLGTVTSLIAVRRGRMESMTNHGTGWVRLEFVVPARGLIGFRTQFLTETRGTGIAHHVFEGYEAWQGVMRGRATGSLVADRSGSATPYAMFNLQERGSLFVPPGTEVYEGMIVGENSRPDDMDVNITRERKVTNVRQSTGEELERLVPPRLLSLEQALEFCADDECVEVTGPAVRLRKTILDAKERGRARGRASRAT